MFCLGFVNWRYKYYTVCLYAIWHARQRYIPISDCTPVPIYSPYKCKHLYIISFIQIHSYQRQQFWLDFPSSRSSQAYTYMMFLVAHAESINRSCNSSRRYITLRVPILYTYNILCIMCLYSVYIIFYLIYYYVHTVARQITLAIIQRVTRHASSRRLLCKVDCHRVRRV